MVKFAVAQELLGTLRTCYGERHFEQRGQGVKGVRLPGKMRVDQLPQRVLIDEVRAKKLRCQQGVTHHLPQFRAHRAAPVNQFPGFMTA